MRFYFGCIKNLNKCNDRFSGLTGSTNKRNSSLCPLFSLDFIFENTFVPYPDKIRQLSIIELYLNTYEVCIFLRIGIHTVHGFFNASFQKGITFIVLLFIIISSELLLV